MHPGLATASLLLLRATISIALIPDAIFSNLRISSDKPLSIPSIHESAVQARRILYLQNIATLSTIFPAESASENRPHDVDNTPIGLMEYYASCGPHSYNPTILGVTIATTMKNAAAGSNVTLSLRYHLPSDAPPTDDPWAYLPANLPRFSLIGYLEKIPLEDVEKYGVRDCFIKSHPEAKIWEPGTDIHESWWGRVVVQEVYFFGGFGDRARIGWIAADEWKNITQEEVDAYKLVGEKDYKSYEMTSGVKTTTGNERLGMQASLGEAANS